MRVKSVMLNIGARGKALKQFAETLARARKGLRVEKREALSFATLRAFRKALTEKRLKLLRAIKEQKPSSVYALAKLVQRDLKSVNTDLSILQKLGLVALQQSRDERHRTTPHLLFDRIRVEVEV